MQDEVLYDLLSALLVFIVGGIFVYLCVNLKEHLRKLSIAFTVFVFVHGFYHVLRIWGHGFVADNILEPFSVAALIVFGIIFLKIKKKKFGVVHGKL